MFRDSVTVGVKENGNLPVLRMNTAGKGITIFKFTILHFSTVCEKREQNIANGKQSSYF